MLLQLFWLFFKINVFTPSGPASYGLTQKLAVPTLISQDKFAQFVAISSGIPGSDAIQMAWQVGYEVAKIKGAIVAVLGALTPCILLVSLVMIGLQYIQPTTLSKFMNGVKPALILLLITTAIGILPFGQLTTNRYLISTLIAAVLMYFKAPLTLTLVICGISALL